MHACSEYDTCVGKKESMGNMVFFLSGQRLYFILGAEKGVDESKRKGTDLLVYGNSIPI